MSRILKRPMFRRGGKVNEGIMSGLVDRTNYEKGAFGNMTEDQIRSNIDMLVGLQDQFSPVAKTRLPLGDVGLALIAGQSPIDALATGYKKFTSEDDKRRALLDKRKQAAVSTVLGQALKEKKTTIPANKEARNTSNRVINGVPPGKIGFFTNEMINALGGDLTPVDDRMITLKDGRVIPYEEYKKTETKIDNAREIVGAVNTVGQIKDKMIADLKETPTGPVGSLYGILEATSDQFSQASQALGFNNDSLDFDVNTSEKLDKYLEKKGVTKGAANFAKMKGSVINLAYLLAKIKEPGNPKLSEGDIIRQLDRLKFGASKDVFAATLNNVFDDEVIGARGQITGYGLNPDDFFGTGTKKSTEEGKGSGESGSQIKDNDPFNIR